MAMESSPGPEAAFAHLAALRREYAAHGLSETELPPEPLELFAAWFGQVHEAGLPEPNAMTVASATPTGAPSVRMVLLKGIVDGAFCFYTNLGSRKARELLANPRAALLFPWYPLQRQVRVEGTAQPLTRDQVETYFATRPRAAQLGAWASHQSEVVHGREELDAAYADAERRFADQEVPCPPGWGGFAVRPVVVEFWQGRQGRMHDRLVYRRAGEGWARLRLAP